MEKVVLVNFVESNKNYNIKDYAYKTNLDLEVGDICVVGVPSDGDVLYKTVKVVETEGLAKQEIERASRWIVQKVDTSNYKKLVETEKLKQEIRNQLRKRKEEVEEIMLFKMLAKEDPEIKNLLDRLSDIDVSIVPALENNNSDK